MSSIFHVIIHLATGGLLLLTGCATTSSAVERAEASINHPAIYALADQEWERAVYFKPSEEPADIDKYLAPLILQVVGQSNDTGERDRFGKITTDSRGQPAVDLNRPTVYFDRSTADFDGRRHEQLVFLWLYAPSDQGGSAVGLTYCGVRMTFDSYGYPCIWEALSGSSSARLIFVSKSLEDAAAAQHGPPLPGRRFSVEPSLSDLPDMIVARVLSDGPVPMGPIVHLQARTRDVATIICRCMSSQVGEYVETVTYELRPIEDLREQGINLDDRTRQRPNGSDSPANQLRLPSSF